MTESIAEAPVAQSGISRVVRRASAESKPEKDLAGVYRMIHGSAEFPRPRPEWTFADGSENPNEPKTVRAGVHPKTVDANGNVTEWVGDEVWLCHADAKSMLAHNLIETLDTKPSNVGKVWAPPKTQPIYGYSSNGR